MVRPTTKVDLNLASEMEYQKLIKLLDSLSIEQITTPFHFDLDKEKGAHWARDKNIHDVLVHLTEWHKLLLDWVRENQRGNKQPFLKEGYNWKTYGTMNEEFTRQNQESTYEDALTEFITTHQQVMELLETCSNEDLFRKDVFDWVGGSTLGSYFVSVTASHYAWATKKIRKFKKMLT